jgi:hypothetical protein
MQVPHAAPSGWPTSGGQAAELPVQFSAASQRPVPVPRQTVDDEAKASAGQVA